MKKYATLAITDFGISKATVSEATSILGGTLGFAASEQIDPSFGTVSPRTDINAVGGLVHWFIDRTPPNAGHQLGEIIENTLATHEEEPMAKPDSRSDFARRRSDFDATSRHCAGGSANDLGERPRLGGRDPGDGRETRRTNPGRLPC